jgi:CRP-like cAMP-binding protein
VCLKHVILGVLKKENFDLLHDPHLREHYVHYSEILWDKRYFNRMSEQEMRMIVFFVQKREYIKSSVVVKEGEEIQGVYVISKGVFEKTQ